ncbi:hypothetical protein [Methylorubrum zatmanii]
MKDRILFRPQRGGLAEAMAEIREIADHADLVAHLQTVFAPMWINVRDDMVRVTKYGDRVDTRIGWDTHIVTIEGWGVAGFTNAPL